MQMSKERNRTYGRCCRLIHIKIRINFVVIKP